MRRALLLFFAASTAAPLYAADPLPSWRDSVSKSAIVDFVERVTRSGEGFVPVAERIAVFDNDGTIWAENPLPFQVAFALDELRRLAPGNPDWSDDPAVRAALSGDAAALLADHHKGLARVIQLTHSGMTADEYGRRVAAWLGSARHPRFDRRYDACVYQPMLELLAYLRENGFKTYIVSGGGADFMRVWTERVYGIPPEQVVGSYAGGVYELRDEGPVIVKSMDQDFFFDDKQMKPVAIHRFLGRRPIACFGNSDGDKQMLEYTTINNPRASLGVIIHHTDAEREYAYDRQPKSSGKLDQALDDAPRRGWVLVDMQKDWEVVFPE